MAIFTIYKNFDFLIPDAPELIQTFMAAVRPLESVPSLNHNTHLSRFAGIRYDITSQRLRNAPSRFIFSSSRILLIDLRASRKLGRDDAVECDRVDQEGIEIDWRWKRRSSQGEFAFSLSRRITSLT